MSFCWNNQVSDGGDKKIYKEFKGGSHEQTRMIEQEIADNIKMDLRKVNYDEW